MLKCVHTITKMFGRRWAEMRIRNEEKKAMSLCRWITLAISADLDKFTRMLRTCLSPVSRVNFVSLSRLSPPPFLAFSPYYRCIDIAEVRRSGGLNGTFVDPPHGRVGLGDGTDPLPRKAENRRTRKETCRETNRKRSERMKREGERRAHSFVSRGAEAGIQALLSGTPILRVSDSLEPGESRTWKTSFLALHLLLLLLLAAASRPFRF